MKNPAYPVHPCDSVAADRELIARFEKKIQATLARVWGKDAEHGYAG